MARPKGMKHTKETKDKISKTMTEYKDEYADKLVEFFSADFWEDIKIPHYKAGEISWEDIKRMSNPLPTFVRFARDVCGVDYDTFNKWVNAKDSQGEPRYPKLISSYIYAKELQKDFLIQNGLAGLYNAGFAQFVAKNITDMKDESEQKNTGEVIIRIVDYARDNNRPTTPVDAGGTSAPDTSKSGEIQGAGMAQKSQKDNPIVEQADTGSGKVEGNLLVHRPVLQPSQEDRLARPGDVGEVLSTEFLG